MKDLGIDYASVDGNSRPNVDLLRDFGVSFAIVRGSYPVNGRAYVDTHLARDRAALTAGGIVVGSYVILGYNAAGPTPEDQVGRFVDAFGTRAPGELCPFLDVEFPQGRAATGMSADAAIVWIERAYDALVKVYGVVGTYTSLRVWNEDLASHASHLGEGPLWMKIPYPYKTGQPPHPSSRGTLTELPLPWRSPASPGLVAVQFQGDARGVDGMSSTVDLSYWAPASTTWLDGKLAAAGAPNLGAVTLAQRIDMARVAAGLPVGDGLDPQLYAHVAR